MTVCECGLSGFARSDEILPPPELVTVIGIEYEQQCRVLCYGPFPTWAEVHTRFNDLRNLL